MLRRLNRTEYENTLRDLLDLPGLKVKDLLPEDGRAFGFDKSAAGLDLSYVQLAKYMEAADVALDAAIAPHAARPALGKAHIPGGGSPAIAAKAVAGMTVFLKDFKYDDSIMPVLEKRVNRARMPKTKTLVKDLRKHPYHRHDGDPRPRGRGRVQAHVSVHVRVRGPVQDSDVGLELPVGQGGGEAEPGDRVRLAAGGRADAGIFRCPVAEADRHRDRGVAEPDDDAPRSNPIQRGLAVGASARRQADEIRRAGDRRGLAGDRRAAAGSVAAGRPSPAVRRPAFHGAAADRRGKKGKPRKGQRSRPATSTFPSGRPQNALRRMLAGHGKPYITNLASLPKTIEFSTVASKAPEADAHRLLADFLPRAFRRPVADDEVQRYVGLVKARLDDGDMFEVAMRTAYKAALCSPDFLFLKEPAGQARRLGGGLAAVVLPVELDAG